MNQSWPITKAGINSYVGYEGTERLKENLLLYLSKGGDRKRRLYARYDDMINGLYDPSDYPEYFYKLWPEMLYEGVIVK